MTTPNGKALGDTKSVTAYTGWSREKFHALIKEGVFKNFGSAARIKVSWFELETYLNGKKAA
jgi:hypothetical protein